MCKDNSDTFAQYCLQTLAPLINFPFITEDRETIKSQSHPCTCSKSGCLKLYCECFAKGLYCVGCNCINCFNTPKYEAIRNAALNELLAKNSESLKKKRNKGCNCKKSNCLKKYCRCHNRGRVCGEECKCTDCKNLRDSQV